MINLKTGGAREVAKLIYPMNVSLDGYMEDIDGNLGWSISDDEIFAFWTDFQRSIGTYLYGRQMYESMVYWEKKDPQTPSNFVGGEQPKRMQQFAQIWQSADKVVYSRTLEEVLSDKTRIEREFNPDAIRQLKESLSTDITISGANLAGQAIRAGLIDEFHFLIHPIILGGGNSALPDDILVQLQLVNEYRFKSGVVHLHYRIMDYRS